MNLAYFTNQYPKVSHTFIRREIIALEGLKHKVARFALKTDESELVDPLDISELKKTSYVLFENKFRIAFICMRVFSLQPIKFISVLMSAIVMGVRSDRGLLRHIVYFLESCVLLRWQQQREIQHIHAHFGTNSTSVAMFAHFLGGAPYSFTVHGPEEFDKPEFIHLSKKIQHSKFVVAISSFGRSQLYRCVTHEYWPKVVEVHCGLEPAFYDGPVEPVSDTNRLVCVGRLCEQKGQLLLLEAVRQLSDKNIEFELILAGDGEMRLEIEQLISQYGLHSRVKILGWISSKQVRQELLASRALVLPSFAEGLPVVIMEAMAVRRPVLSTYVAGIPELVIQGENGWLFPAGSVEALVEALEECLATPIAELNKMGEAGFALARQRHCSDTEARKMADLFTMP